MEEERNYCVYMHTSPSGKRYVGITRQSIKERWQNGRGYKHNEHFKSAILKYGWDNFKHEILFDKLTEKEALRLETICIVLFKTFDREYGYNKTMGGEAPVRPENYVPHNVKAIYCLETDQIYDSLAAAQRAFGFATYTGILETCQKKYRHCHGKHFCYLEDKDEFLKNASSYNKDDKRVYCFTNQQVYETTGIAAKATNTPLRTVQRRCIDKNQKETKTGYSFSYFRDLPEVMQNALESR